MHAETQILYPGQISGRPAETSPAAGDLFVIVDVSTGLLKQVTRSNLGTSILSGAGVLLADGTVPLTADWDAGAFEVRAETFQSDVTTGTPPLIVASSTLVTNLNADMVDGAHLNDGGSGSGDLWSAQQIQSQIDLAVAGLYDHKGSYDASTNTPDLDTSPSGILKADAYTVSVAGNFFGVAVEAGDLLIADQDNPTTADHWTIVNRNIDSNAFAAASHTHAASDVTSGTLEHERGGLEADISAYNGVPLVTGGTTSQLKYNLAATAAPTVDDDTGDGYSVGSRWIDVTNDKEYVCLDASSGAAVWTETTQTGGGGSGDTLPVVDTTALVKDPADATKLVRIDAGAIATATTRVISMGDRDVDLSDGGTFAELSHNHDASYQPLDSDLTTIAAANNGAVLAATTASFLTADETKLDGIEAGADVTDATNVDAAGAVMNTDTTTAAMSFVVDEDNMASNLATKVPTQQSVKAYVDSAIAGLTFLASEDIDTLAEINAILGDATLVTVEATDASGYGWVVDEDDMTSNSASKVPTQQSVKAYVDNLTTGDTLPVVDTTALVKDPADATKRVRIDAGAVATATTRVITMGDRNVDLSEGGTFAERSHNHDAAYQPLDSDLTTIAAANNGAVLAATTASFLTADETKLDGIEAGADVTDATNVDAAGAVMNTDTTTAAMSFVVDEDNMESNLATKVPTQQSVKAYVDALTLGDTLPVVDTTALVKNLSDDTKRVRIFAGGLTTGTTRVITMGDRNVDLSEGGTFAELSHNHDASYAAIGHNHDASYQPLDSDLTTIAAANNGAVLAATTASFLTADETKLDGIETGADVTDSTNVDAAGAVMNTDTTTAAMSFVVDEDNMASNLATKVPTQQSVKAYVDSAIAGLTFLASEDIDTLAEINAILGDATLVTVEATDASGYGWVVDEDDMTSNSASKVPTQQSVKAYVDASVGIESVLADTTPQLGGQLDVNGHAIGNGTEELINFTETPSAVNEITITNAATGNKPVIAASGDDATIDLYVQPKGATGKVWITRPAVDELHTLQSTPQKVIALGADTPSVNYFTMSAGATGESVTIEATGSDSNIVLELAGKGTGKVRVDASFGAMHTLTDGATVAVDASDGNRQRVTLGGNRTITFSNFSAGQSVLLMLRQDGTGSRTVTWPTIRWAGGSAPTLTTTASKEDHVVIFYDGSEYFGSVAGQNF